MTGESGHKQHIALLSQSHRLIHRCCNVLQGEKQAAVAISVCLSSEDKTLLDEIRTFMIPSHHADCIHLPFTEKAESLEPIARACSIQKCSPDSDFVIVGRDG